MARFHKLEEFERRFDSMDVAELERWKVFWTEHALQFAPKGRKQAMKRVHEIEGAIELKGGHLESPAETPEPAAEHGVLPSSPTKKGKARAGRILYIECKAGALAGTARIGRVTFSQTGRTLYYGGQKFQSLKGKGFKSNYYNVETREDYWISGPKRNGGDALYGSRLPVEIDENVREEYWRDIRRQPERIRDPVA